MSEAPHLGGLNPEQLRAVTTLDGPVLVLAGAGSGKTRVLTRRVAHLLHVGVAPENVLAVTFTNKAAQEMRERVVELVGERAEKVWVSTFHSTCCRILRKEAVHLGYTKRFSIYDDDDQRRLMRHLIQEAAFDADRQAADEILRTIDQYKNRLLTPDKALAERRTHVGDRTLRLWRAYEEALKANDAVDFNDLIGLVARLFEENPEALARWQEQFHYVLVDEYQDTNHAQYQLLRRLTENRQNLAVVGDDDQSIYGFRGADITNILHFQRDYPGAIAVRLEQNYRSTGHILAAANAVVTPNTGRLPKVLWTEAAPGPRVQLVLALDPREEADRVAQMITELARREDLGWGDFAVIYRTNLLARNIEVSLRRARIPYRVVGGRRFWERREVRDILAWLRLISNPADDAAFLRALGAPPCGVGAKTVQALRAQAATAGVPLSEAARRSGSASAAERALLAFSGRLTTLTDLARDLPLPDLVARVLDDSGYLGMLTADKDPDAEERLGNLRQLVQEAGNADPEGGATHAEALATWLDSTTLRSDTDEIPAHGEVALMTVHSAKGLEYPIVFVVQLNEDTFPHSRAGEEGIEEERRLAYVAFTRARKRLFLLRTRQLPDPPGGPARPSRFLFGLPEAVLTGDVPDGQPASASPKVRALEGDARARLAALVGRHSPPARPTPPIRTVEREIDEDSPPPVGARVNHVRFGRGSVVRHGSGGLAIRFDQGGVRHLSSGEGLSWIEEDS